MAPRRRGRRQPSAREYAIAPALKSATGRRNFRKRRRSHGHRWEQPIHGNSRASPRIAAAIAAEPEFAVAKPISPKAARGAPARIENRVTCLERTDDEAWGIIPASLNNGQNYQSNPAMWAGASLRWHGRLARGIGGCMAEIEQQHPTGILPPSGLSRHFLRHNRRWTHRTFSG
jgi:hypothetical protein